MAPHGRIPVLSVLILINQTVGVVCQFVQGTDPRFPLLYFSVNSAVLAAVAAALTLIGYDGAWYRRIRLAAVVGVLMSAVVYAAVIAPATPTGSWFQPNDDLPVRMAVLLIHGVAPVLVTAEYLLRPTPLSARASTLWGYAWPLAYLAGIGILTAIVGPDTVPYPFLRPSVTGWPTVAGAYVALLALVGVLGWLVGTSAGRADSRMRGTVS
ncbi:hypothetical protein [Mycolicibacterium vanbaalenii]|nr:hypothetical protein [Mycolicibacterium vanbaalenii]MCV7126950.1 hypothetical protein [Mycolicibacterium vanbaalenii PYR-1]